MPTIYDVANYFRNCVERGAGSVITHLKLQKLCYYAQAWHLVFEDRPLFNAEFQAWTHGPVCPELYQEYREYGYNPIPAADDFDPTEIFTQEQLELLDEIWDTYGRYDGKYLEDLTHEELPWIEARAGIPEGMRCNNGISEETMKRYYKEKLEKAQGGEH
jgi:uncharacterized phage-associated protein